MTVRPWLVVQLIYLPWCWREQPLSRRLELNTVGLGLPEIEGHDAALALFERYF
jgi:hypothetical protein